MSIFVEDTDLIDVSVSYVEDGKTITIVELPNDKAKTIKVSFRRPDFATSQRLISSSTVTDQNGNSTVNIMMLQNNMIYMLAKSWDVKEDSGKPVEVNNENISRMRVEISRALMNALMQVVGPLL